MIYEKTPVVTFSITETNVVRRWDLRISLKRVAPLWSHPELDSGSKSVKDNELL